MHMHLHMPRFRLIPNYEFTCSCPQSCHTLIGRLIFRRYGLHGLPQETLKDTQKCPSKSAEKGLFEHHASRLYRHESKCTCEIRPILGGYSPYSG